MFEENLTKNNHLKFGFRSDFDDRYSANDNLYLSLTRCSRAPYDWRTECLLAAKDIAASTTKPICVLMSGGVDSEIVALSFLFARIPFKVTIARFKNDLNLHDIGWAVKFCETNGISYDFTYIDIEEFYNSKEIVELAITMGISAPMNLLQCKLVMDVCRRGEFPVTGNGDMLFRYFEKKWFIYYAEHFLKMALTTRKIGAAGVVWFFQYTPELKLAWLLDAEIQAFIAENRHDLSKTGEPVFVHKGYYPREDLNVTQKYRPVKVRALQNHFNIEGRPKFRGFESFGELEKNVAVKLDAQLKGPTQHLLYSVGTVLDLLAP